MTKDEARTPAQFFFEVGFGAAYAKALIDNDMEPPFEYSDAVVERAWEMAGEIHEDHEEFDRYLSAADRLEALAQPVVGDEWREQAISAAYLAIYGEGMDPFEHPEGWEYASTIADAILSLSTPVVGGN